MRTVYQAFKRGTRDGGVGWGERGGADLRRNGGDGTKGMQTCCSEASVFKSPRRFGNNGHAGRSDMSSGERHTSGERGGTQSHRKSPSHLYDL